MLNQYPANRYLEFVPRTSIPNIISIYINHVPSIQFNVSLLAKNSNPNFQTPKLIASYRSPPTCLDLPILLTHHTIQLNVVSSSRLDEIDILNAMLIPDYPQTTLLSEIPNNLFKLYYRTPESLHFFLTNWQHHY